MHTHAHTCTHIHTSTYKHIHTSTYKHIQTSTYKHIQTHKLRLTVLFSSPAFNGDTGKQRVVYGVHDRQNPADHHLQRQLVRERHSGRRRCNLKVHCIHLRTRLVVCLRQRIELNSSLQAETPYGVATAASKRALSHGWQSFFVLFSHFYTHRFM